MADETDRTEQSTADELASNMWFTEYGMPYTTALLEAEAQDNKDHPENAGQPRHELAQFIIDQETAVARDYHDGKISEAEFNAFKERSQEMLDASIEKFDTEIEEFEDDVSDWGDDFEVSVNAFSDEHKVEIKELTDLAKTDEIEGKDISLHLLGDAMALTVDGVDDLLERVPPHLHDVVNVVRDETLGNARELMEARGELSSADEHDLSRDEEKLEAIEPVFEADVEDTHEAIDDEFERIDNAISDVQDYVGDVQEHGERNPELNVEHMPTRHVDDYDLPEQIEDDTGITEA